MPEEDKELPGPLGQTLRLVPHHGTLRAAPPSSLGRFHLFLELFLIISVSLFFSFLSFVLFFCRPRFAVNGSECHVTSASLQRHDECVAHEPIECTCGPLRDHVLPPWAIYPVIKVRHSRLIRSRFLPAFK